MKETAIYGVSSMLGRFINWALFPLYVNKLPSPADYGIVTNLYAWTGLALIFLTYGMETGFFRFIEKSDRPRVVYGNSLFCLASTSVAFVIGALLFLNPIAGSMGYASQKDLVGILVGIVAIDAFVSIPFAYLRATNQAKLFALLRLGYILFMVFLNILFLVIFPWMAQQPWGEWILTVYHPGYGVGYIFVSNLVANIVLLIAMIPYMRPAQWKIEGALIVQMLFYSLPILLTGIAGNFNKMADKILLPMLYDDPSYAAHQLGVYSAGFKIAIIIVMFSQAFRYAYEPFVFRSSNKIPSEEKKKEMIQGMEYYVLFSLMIMAGVMAYLDLLKLILPSSYYDGLVVVPIVMLSEITFGVVFNHSLWYKITDRTFWGVIISVIGCTLTILLIIWGVPRMGFIACAYASVISNMVMLIVSYCASLRYFPVRYRVGSALYQALVVGVYLWIISLIRAQNLSLGVTLMYNTLLLLLALSIMIGKKRLKMLIQAAPQIIQSIHKKNNTNHL